MAVEEQQRQAIANKLERFQERAEYSSNSARAASRLPRPAGLDESPQMGRASAVVWPDNSVVGTNARIAQLDADLLTSGEIERLMRQCSRRAPTGVRNCALIAVCWRCGLRIGETLALAVKDFDPESGTLIVQRGKGGKRRVVGVDAGTVALVSRWLDVRRKRRITAGPLFCTLKGRPLNQSYIRHLLPRLARKASIERRVHAHGLRHAFAVDLVRSGAPLYVVRDALGHTSIATTQVYLSRVGAHEAVDAMRNRQWPGP
jgi:site-specific recombinase XerD